ncbi:hypothetical protein [Streptomyces sp. NPDC001450]
MRRCRYRGRPKVHLQHIFTAIAVNIEHLSGLPPTGELPRPRPPTTFQNFLDQHEILRLGPGGPSAIDKIPDRVKRACF